MKRGQRPENRGLSPKWFGYDGDLWTISATVWDWKMTVHPVGSQLLGGTGATLAGPGGDDAAKVLVVDGVRAHSVVHYGRVRRRRETVRHRSDVGRRGCRRGRGLAVVDHSDTTVFTDTIRHLHSATCTMLHYHHY